MKIGFGFFKIQNGLFKIHNGFFKIAFAFMKIQSQVLCLLRILHIWTDWPETSDSLNEAADGAF